MKDKNIWGSDAQKPLIPSLVHLINRHSGDSRFLMSLQTTCRFLVSSGQIPGYRKELFDDTNNNFAYPEDEGDFQQLMQDCEDGTLTPQMLSDAITIIDSILASNTGTEMLDNAADS